MARAKLRMSKKIILVGGGRSGLVVIGGDSFPEGCKFESKLCILDGRFLLIFVVKIAMFD